MLKFLCFSTLIFTVFFVFLLYKCVTLCGSYVAHLIWFLVKP